MRVWIEIAFPFRAYVKVFVTLYVRVWIEMLLPILKCMVFLVTLYVRVWIEIPDARLQRAEYLGHPLREGVD